MPDVPVITEFLKKMHLFRGLTDEQLASVAAELKDRSFADEGEVFAQGDAADSLYIVLQGRVNVSRKAKEKDIKLASLVRGDYFGEQGLLTGQRRNATVRAEKGTVLLILYRDPFKALMKKIPGMHANFEVMMSSRKLAAQLRFRWVGQDEIIYFLARKHSFLLFRAMILPVLVVICLLGLLRVAYSLGSAAIGAVGGFLLVVDIAWGIWRYVDWGNDFYIVTNQRVIWLEKVIGLYDSRTEANMGTILSISSETDQFGRWLDFGTVVVRTFTGQIRMEFVRRPKQAAAMIEEYWMRSKDVARKADEETIRQTIRNKLGVNPLPKPAVPLPPVRPAPKAASKEFFLRTWWRDAFKMRIEEGGTVTYRKHIYVLFRDTIGHNLGFLLLLVAPFGWNFILGGAPPRWFWSALVFLFILDLGLWIYEYLDWSNDLYQVTADQIVDIYRKPLGTEDRKAAPLENILSTEYKRRGILGVLLNFGTVYIMVGGAQFNFDDVADPPTVQQDIVRRQQTRLIKKKEADTSADRERIADWLVAYHRTLEEIQREKPPNSPKPE